jgi:hypothetical protein
VSTFKECTFTEYELDDIGHALIETNTGADSSDERQYDRIQWARNMIYALELEGFRLLRASEAPEVLPVFKIEKP